MPKIAIAPTIDIRSPAGWNGRPSVGGFDQSRAIKPPTIDPTIPRINISHHFTSGTRMTTFAIHPEMNPIIRYQTMFNIVEDQFEPVGVGDPGNRWFGGPGDCSLREYAFDVSAERCRHSTMKMYCYTSLFSADEASMGDMA
jgi:hypothetical protein